MKPKYALYEIERRWLLEQQPPEASTRPIVITDKYVNASRLRLRSMALPDGDAVFKLCKKYGDRQGPSEPITNLYLDATEHQLLNALPGITVTKRRYRLESGAVDIYGEGSSSTCIFEIEFENLEAANDYAPPSFVGREITEDPTLTGLALARRYGR